MTNTHLSWKLHDAQIASVYHVKARLFAAWQNYRSEGCTFLASGTAQTYMRHMQTMRQMKRLIRQIRESRV